MKELDQRLDETVKEREAKYSEALVSIGYYVYAPPAHPPPTPVSSGITFGI